MMRCLVLVWAGMMFACADEAPRSSAAAAGGAMGIAPMENGGRGGTPARPTNSAGATAPRGTAGRAVGGERGAAGTSGSSAAAGSGEPSRAGAGAGAGAGAVLPSGADVIWPNDQSRANSDAWLAMNHDRITQLRPRVLVIDLEQTATATAMSLVERHINALKEASSFHKYKDPGAKPALAYELVKIVGATKPSGRIDYNAWNTQAFADANLQLKDPADPNGPNLTLCGAFEKGVINEVWCMASSDPKCGETQEYKQVYDADGKKLANKFASVSNGDNISSLGCKVSARITDFNSGRGAGCHQHALGHAWERYMDGGAVPQLGKQAKRFLNWDLNTRVGAPFSSFYGACNSNSMQLTNCIVWASNVRAQSGQTATKMFDIADMSGGCGNAHFYANTTGTYSYDANMPDPEVLTSCEHYGMHNGAGWQGSHDDVHECDDG